MKENEIPREVIDAVRDRTEIVDLVSRHVRLQRRGSSWVGLCPFHQEKTPSFSVIPEKGMFYCFGCQASGDAIRFLRDLQGLTFREAVQELASAAGVTIPERELTEDERRALQHRATLYDVVEEAARWFEAQLWTGPEGGEARAYLQRRAITDETAHAARLGLAPSGWTRLVDHLHRKGFRAELVAAAGLSKPSDRPGGSPYDTFRDRLIVPIRDERGRVIAFGGRLLAGDGPKYLNSPETELYDKGRVLYGLDVARRAIVQTDRVIVVEGYFDALAMLQAGFGEVVATCGTALTAEHVDRIRRLASRVVVLLDADEAGARAAEKALPLLDRAGLVAERLQLPGAKDPDELIREGGRAAMEAALRQVGPLLAWVAERRVRAHGYTAAGKVRARDDLVAMLGGTLTAAQVAEVAPVLRLDERELLTWAKGRAVEHPEPTAPSGPAARLSREASHLLWLLVHRHRQVSPVIGQVKPAVVESSGVVHLIAPLVVGRSIREVMDDPAHAAHRAQLAAVVASPNLYAEDRAVPALLELLVGMARPTWTARAETLRTEAVRALRAGDREASSVAWGALERLQADARALDLATLDHDVDAVVALLGRLCDDAKQAP